MVFLSQSYVFNFHRNSDACYVNFSVFSIHVFFLSCVPNRGKLTRWGHSHARCEVTPDATNFVPPGRARPLVKTANLAFRYTCSQDADGGLVSACTAKPPRRSPRTSSARKPAENATRARAPNLPRRRARTTGIDTGWGRVRHKRHITSRRRSLQLVRTPHRTGTTHLSSELINRCHPQSSRAIACDL